MLRSSECPPPLHILKLTAAHVNQDHPDQGHFPVPCGQDSRGCREVGAGGRVGGGKHPWAPAGPGAIWLPAWSLEAEGAFLPWLGVGAGLLLWGAAELSGSPGGLWLGWRPPRLRKVRAAVQGAPAAPWRNFPPPPSPRKVRCPSFAPQELSPNTILFEDVLFLTAFLLFRSEAVAPWRGAVSLTVSFQTFRLASGLCGFGDPARVGRKQPRVVMQWDFHSRGRFAGRACLWEAGPAGLVLQSLPEPSAALPRPSC